jgi:hypothetical protein
LTVRWNAPEYNGGFPVTSYTLYHDNTVVSLNPTLNYYQISGLTLGNKIKL